MNSSDVPSKIIDCSLVEVLPSGQTLGLGLFTKRGLAVSLHDSLLKSSPANKYEIRPWHPEFPGFKKTEGVRV